MFISVGSNRHPYAADYCVQLNIVAYAACSVLALWDIKSNRVVTTLCGHASQITAVKFIGKDMISGSDNGEVILWKCENANSYSVKSKLTMGDTAKSITCISIHNSLLVVGSADGNVRVYTVNDLELAEKAALCVGKLLHPLTVAVQELSDGQPIVAVGGTSKSVYIYSGDQFDRVDLEGHDGWIRALAFKETEGELVLASGSQDKYIRLWRVQQRQASPKSALELTNKVYLVGSKHQITFEALVIGHDDWVFTVAWHPERLSLLSASADSSLMIWDSDEASGIWVCTTRLGDISTKGASTATGSSGGFYDALWIHDGVSFDAVTTVGKTGSWRRWARDAQSNEWNSLQALTGHCKEVTDISWSPNGNYLLSTSLDQTTRLWCRAKDGWWYEMSRPQIHGYDMMAVTCISETVFASAGDEKTIRIFQLPGGVAQLLGRVSDVEIVENADAPASATVPALGLSNKEAVVGEDVMDAEESEDSTENKITTLLSELNGPPREDQLQRLTLWPEIEKLYGHGYEIVCLAVSADKRYLATCCKANNEDHGVIRVYDIENGWIQMQPPLKHHVLTVTSLRFAPQGTMLLSVSRDRSWSVWDLVDGVWTAIDHQKGHSRIIWDGCWISQTKFLTASRDRCIKVWELQDSWKPVLEDKFDEPVTAVEHVPGTDKVIIGLDSGQLIVYTLTSQEKVYCESSPVARITKIRQNGDLIAVSSADTSLRIYTLGSSLQ